MLSLLSAGRFLLQDDAEIAAAVDAEMRERLSESDESSDAEDDADDSTPNKTSDKSNKQLASSEGEDDEQTPPPPPAAAAKASGRKSQQRQQSADTAGAAGGYGKGSVVRNSMGGKKPDDPLLNFVISEDTRSCNVEVSATSEGAGGGTGQGPQGACAACCLHVVCESISCHSVCGAGAHACSSRARLVLTARHNQAE